MCLIFVNPSVEYVLNDSVWIQYGILGICLTDVLDNYVPHVYPSSLKGHREGTLLLKTKVFLTAQIELRL